MVTGLGNPSIFLHFRPKHHCPTCLPPLQASQRIRQTIPAERGPLKSLSSTLDGVPTSFANSLRIRVGWNVCCGLSSQVHPCCELPVERLQKFRRQLVSESLLRLISGECLDIDEGIDQRGLVLSEEMPETVFPLWRLRKAEPSHDMIHRRTRFLETSKCATIGLNRSVRRSRSSANTSRCVRGLLIQQSLELQDDNLWKQI